VPLNYWFIHISRPWCRRDATAREEQERCMISGIASIGVNAVDRESRIDHGGFGSERPTRSKAMLELSDCEAVAIR
jgi:hypothetical protein